MRRENISSGTQWEADFAYSRAVVKVNFIFVSGTTAVDENGNVHGDNVYEQACYVFEKINDTLVKCGAGMCDVVRTRMFITDIDKSSEAGMAHRKFFEGINPAATMVEVSRLIDPALLIEIEVDAIKNS